MILLRNILAEGVYDRRILKCVFMAGGPGSGKSWVINDVFGVPKRSSLSGAGLKVLDSDGLFSDFLRKNGIDPKELGRIRSENPEFYYGVIDSGIKGDRNTFRQKAIVLTKGFREFYLMNKLGVIIDGTGAHPSFIEDRKVQVEGYGYDTAMVFVNTSLEVAQRRNRERERSLSEDIIEKMWHDCQKNLALYRSMFGNNMFIVDNSANRPVDSEVKSAIYRFLDRPVANPIGKQWIEDALKVRDTRKT